MEVSIELFAQLMGVSFPWAISEGRFDATKRELWLQISLSPLASGEVQASFLSHSPVSSTYTWQHDSLSGVKVFIQSTHAGISVAHQGFERNQLLCPAFLGAANRSYTHGLRQSVATAYHLGLLPSAIVRLLGVGSGVVNEIIQDIEQMPANQQILAAIPRESDSIWVSLLRSDFELVTKDFALKLLLSKLQGVTLEGQVDLAAGICELRKYLISHGGQLSSEMLQLIGVQQVNATAGAVAGDSQLIPSHKHPVWERLLSGKVKMTSKNVALNLLLSQSKGDWNQVANAKEKEQLIKNFRAYFVKNARILHGELNELGQMAY